MDFVQKNYEFLKDAYRNNTWRGYLNSSDDLSIADCTDVYNCYEDFLPEKPIEITKQVIETLNELENKTKYYEIDGNVFLELDDAHVLWDLEPADVGSMENSMLVDEMYFELARGVLEEVSARLKTDILPLGRSGRHICIDCNFDNLLNYIEYKDYYTTVRDNMINSINVHGLMDTLDNIMGICNVHNDVSKKNIVSSIKPVQDGAEQLKFDCIDK